MPCDTVIFQNNLVILDIATRGKAERDSDKQSLLMRYRQNSFQSTPILMAEEMLKYPVLVLKFAVGAGH